jgi:hypothetical protein
MRFFLHKPLLGLTLWVSLCIVGITQINAQTLSTWYFGDKAGVYFAGSGNVVTLNNSQMTTPEGCATYESSVSSLILYSNGSKIWSSTGQVINNGANLYGSINSCQSALFYLPPQTDTLYTFTTDDYLGSKGLCYNKIPTRSSPLAVVEKNESLLIDATERMTLTMHCDMKSMWLITHQRNIDAFYAFKINNEGEISAPVISHVGSIHGGNAMNAKGCMRVSLEGGKLALAKNADGVVELFNFDNRTGIVYDPIMISGIPNAYGVEFDRTGRMLYVSTLSGQLLQFFSSKLEYK